MRRLIVCLAGCALALLGQDRPLGPGFTHFYNNEYDQALAIFEQQVREHPEDATAWNAVAQAILYREMFRDGALESELVTGSNAFLRRSRMEVSPRDKAQFMNAVDRAISLSAKQLQQNSKDVGALYSLAVAHGLRANFLFLVNKSWMQALHESVAARRANDQILEIDPSFVDAHLIHGISEYTVGCLPAYLRVLAAVDGFHGDKEDGVQQLQLVYAHGVRSRYDAAILLAAIYRRDHRPDDAIPLLKTLATAFPRNYLFRFEEVQMYSDLGNKAAALQVLADIEAALRKQEPGYARLPLERVQYARGNLLFWYGDLDQSLADLKLATRNTNELDLSTAVMAWLRLGQVYDLMGDHRHAAEAYRMTISTAPDSEPAKEAAAYLAKPYQRKKNESGSSFEKQKRVTLTYKMPSEIRTDATGTKAAFYGQVCEQLDQLLGGEENFVANAANTSALLYQLLPDVNWAGFYITEGDELVLGPFQGKPACARLNFGQGVCGSAVAEGETIVVPDVSKFSGHIACDAASQSEIVVPLLSWGNVVGVLDIDSASLNRFDEEDQEGLESVVSVFLAHSSGQLPDLGGDAAE